MSQVPCHVLLTASCLSPALQCDRTGTTGRQRRGRQTSARSNFLPPGLSPLPLKSGRCSALLRRRVGTHRFRLLSVRTIFCVWWRHLACASAVQQVQAPNQAGGNPAASPVISPPCKLHFRTPGHHRCHPASHLLPGVTAAWVTSHPFASSLCHLNPNHLHLSDFDATAGVL